MGFLNELKFRVRWDDLDTVTRLVEKWTPRRCKAEKDYEKSLYDFLHRELGQVQVTKQFAKGRIRADLMVGDKVIIELKHNFDSTAKYQRLIGQLEEYKNWDGCVLIVLTGKSDQHLRKQLASYVKEHQSAVLRDKFAILDK